MGSDPLLMLQVIGVEPLAFSVTEYVLPTMAGGNGEVVVIVGEPDDPPDSPACQRPLENPHSPFWLVLATNSAGGGSCQFGLMSVSACDLNSDGVINTDVTIALMR